MTRIIPGILSEDPRFVQSEIAELAQLDPQPNLLQIDILDGEFAPELTIEPNRLKEFDLHGAQVDIHLMTVEPIDYVSEVRGMSEVRAVIAQIERLHSQAEFIEEVQECHFMPGFSLDLYTPFESLDMDLLTQVGVIQIMGGQAGSQGQTFHDSVLDKIREAAEYRQGLGLEYEILVDIGMNPDTIPAVLQAGADGVVVGSYLQQADRENAWEELLQAAKINEEEA